MSARAEGRLPDFLIVGAQKCGTGALKRALGRHPDLFVAPFELHFFDRYWHRGVAWYRRRFRGSARLHGEKTPMYLYDPRSVERMARTVPNARLVVLLRNPVDRAYSHYQMLLRTGQIADATFEALLEEELRSRTTEPIDYHSAQRHLLRRGLYAAQLEHLWRFFPRSRVLVVVQERMRMDMSCELAEVQRFLGVAVRPTGLDRSATSAYAPMEHETRRWLADYFAESNAALFDALGSRIEEWTEPAASGGQSRRPVRRLVSSRPSASRLEDVLTVVIKTFERPRLLQKLVASLRTYYPRLKILVADDSREPTPPQMRQRLTHLPMPFDSGLSAGRNLLVERVPTEYFLLLDDDHLFMRDTDLGLMLRILVRNGLDLLGGVMINYPEQKPFHYRGQLELEPHPDGNGKLFSINKAPIASLPDHQLYSVVHNFFIARTDAVRAFGGWDNELKIMEHNDFFLRARENRLRVGHTDLVQIHHLSTRRRARMIDSDVYRFFRRARENYFRALFMRKYGIYEMERFSGKRVLFADVEHLLEQGEPRGPGFIGGAKVEVDLPD